MKLHKLKILPKYYEKVISGEKRFEIRKDDRNFKIGDLIRLEEFEGEYTGRDSLYEIIYKLDGGCCGLEEGYCILSIKPYRTFMKGLTLNEVAIYICTVAMIVHMFTDNLDNKDYDKLECSGLCELNISGYMKVWETVCMKCKGTKLEQELIDKSFNSFNARKIIIDKYDFTELEKDILLHQEWY